jgi:hypothetical protein
VRERERKKEVGNRIKVRSGKRIGEREKEVGNIIKVLACWLPAAGVN